MGGGGGECWGGVWGECVCVCVRAVGGGGGELFDCVFLFCFCFIILYVNCFGRTMLYMCIEYHI